MKWGWFVVDTSTGHPPTPTPTSGIVLINIESYHRRRMRSWWYFLVLLISLVAVVMVSTVVGRWLLLLVLLVGVVDVFDGVYA